jgi:hypothetical protein
MAGLPSYTRQRDAGDGVTASVRGDVGYHDHADLEIRSQAYADFSILKSQHLLTVSSRSQQPPAYRPRFRRRSSSQLP